MVFHLTSTKLFKYFATFAWVNPDRNSAEYTESNENFDQFQKKAPKNPLLSEHLKRLGIDPQNISLKQWLFWREANRILHHTMRAVGATYYSAADPKQGGENWHKEQGNIVRNPANGEVIHTGGFADRYPESGNPGHALQKMAKGKATAVWGGKGAHEQIGL